MCSTHARTHVHTHPLALTTPHPAGGRVLPLALSRGARASYASCRRPPVPRPGCSCGRRGRGGGGALFVQRGRAKGGGLPDSQAPPYTWGCSG